MVNSSGPRLIGWKHAWAWARLLALTTLLTATHSTSAWQMMEPTAVAARIARDRQFIDARETQRLTPAQVGRLWSEIASDEQDLGDFGQAEEAYNHALRLLEREPKLQKDYAITLNNLGTLLAASGRGEASLNCRRLVPSISSKSWAIRLRSLALRLISPTLISCWDKTSRLAIRRRLQTAPSKPCRRQHKRTGRRRCWDTASPAA